MNIRYAITMQQPIVSLFSGCGGLDLGFSMAGFEIIWANENDKEIWQTYEKNHQNTYLDKRDLRKIPSLDIPDCLGIIGGPPCQSWSEAGTQKGLTDERGQLFLEYIRVIKDKKPLFFLAENVSGMLHKKHKNSLKSILYLFNEIGYKVSFSLLNTIHYNVPQDRKRVIFIGFHEKLNKLFDFNSLITYPILTLKDTIWDLQKSALAAKEKNYSHKNCCIIPNHEYMIGGFSSIYLSRNRVRSWNEASFTIQASGRHAPIHPQASKMIYVSKDQWKFDLDSPLPYRRLSIRECARIQTFPDTFIFYYDRLASGYKMIGNAVPINFAKQLAQSIYKQLFAQETKKTKNQFTPVQLTLNI